MIRGGDQTWEWTKISIRAVTRSRATLALLGVAGLATGSGVFFEAFDFGESEGQFLLSLSWALQVVALTVVALALSVHLSGQTERSGFIPVALARGVHPASILLGQLLAVAFFCLLWAIGSSAVVFAVNFGGDLSSLMGTGLGVVMLTMSGVLIALVVQWLSSWARELAFVIGASLGVILLGYLRPLAVDIGGVAAWLAMLAPDFAYLGETDWVMGSRSWADALSGIIHSMGYGLVLCWLAARGWGRREF